MQFIKEEDGIKMEYDNRIPEKIGMDFPEVIDVVKDFSNNKM